MKHYVIVELHNGIINSIRGPYPTIDDAYDHADKCEAYRKANPVPLAITWKIMDVYNPEYTG